jgi:hypothetical protein
MATWGRDFEWGGYDWAAEAALRRWPNWGLGVMLTRTNWHVLIAWFALGPCEAGLEVSRTIGCVTESYDEDAYLDEGGHND